MFLQQCYQRTVGIGSQFVVAVYEGDIVTLCPLDAEVAGIGESAVLLLPVFYVLVCSGILLSDDSATVGRTIVDEKYLDIVESLYSHAVNTSSQHLFHIVYRDDYAQCHDLCVIRFFIVFHLKRICLAVEKRLPLPLHDAAL